MYTYHWNSDGDTYIICDKNDITICEVQTKTEAITLLSHLNRK